MQTQQGKPGRKRFEVQLIVHLGPDYKKYIQVLRDRLIKVLEEYDMTLMEAAYKSGTNIATLSVFIGDSRNFLKSETANSTIGKRKRPPRDNISWKTYSILKKFVDKRLKS